MIKRAHNFNEVKALVNEAIDNGTIYDLDGTEWVTHETELHIADIYINKNSEVICRTYNHTAGSINYGSFGKVMR